MKLTGLHILLTYQCTWECDHCFVWGSPKQAGVFTLEQLEEVFVQAEQVGSIKQIYFEGGETFIYYPTLIDGVALATSFGFSTGIVTNGYWAVSVTDAWEWLRPLVRAGLDRLELSSDLFHGHEAEMAETHPGLEAARRLRLNASIISVDPPVKTNGPADGRPGQTFAGGSVMYRGRAAKTLTGGLPRQPWQTFTGCSNEDLVNPSRLHLDPFGNLHLCQGLVMGNMWQEPLQKILSEYKPKKHPIVGPLVAGGPAQLARTYQLDVEPGYVDACHFCYTAREALRARYPEYLAPDQMYGVP